jgi:hypothetical protein
VVEYTQLKREVNDIAFSAPDGLGKGTCIWEPLNTWEQIFEKDGKANELLYLYDDLSQEFINPSITPSTASGPSRRTVAPL